METQTYYGQEALQRFVDGVSAKIREAKTLEEYGVKGMKWGQSSKNFHAKGYGITEYQVEDNPNYKLRVVESPSNVYVEDPTGETHQGRFRGQGRQPSGGSKDVIKPTKNREKVRQFLKDNYGIDHTFTESNRLQGKREFQDLPISIENKVGSIRRGKNPDHPWETKLKNAYGYIRGTTGVDGDHLDVYIGNNDDAEFVYVIHQMKVPDFKKFDEDKIFLGFSSREAAKKSFLQHYDDPKFYGGMTQIPTEQFKKLLDDHDGKKVDKLDKDYVDFWAESMVKDFKEGGAGSGCRGDKCGRPTTGGSKKDSHLGLRKGEFAHGTSIENVKSILKTGLRPEKFDDGKAYVSDRLDSPLLAGLDAAKSSHFAVVVLEKPGSIKADHDGGQFSEEREFHTTKNISPKLIKRVLIYSTQDMKDWDDKFSKPFKKYPALPKPSYVLDRDGKRIKESRFLEAKKPVIYYARPMQKYGTKSEAREVAQLKKIFPKHRIAFSENKLHDKYGMEYFYDKVDEADMVVISPRRKRKLTAGVYSEAAHARHKGIPVKFIKKGKVHTLGKLRTKGGKPWGDFGEAKKRKKPKLRESKTLEQKLNEFGILGMKWGDSKGADSTTTPSKKQSVHPWLHSMTLDRRGYVPVSKDKATGTKIYKNPESGTELRVNKDGSWGQYMAQGTRPLKSGDDFESALDMLDGKRRS